MKIVTRKQMEHIDKTTIVNYKIPSIILMENAGISIFNKIVKLYPEILNKNKKISILIGPGNNGGDGLVVARLLLRYDNHSVIYLLGKEEKFKGDALTNLLIIKKLNAKIITIENEEAFLNKKKEIFNSDFLIDAIFGTGLKGSPREFHSLIINTTNKEFNNIITSIDVPSGITSDINKKSNTIIKANDTITVELPKINMIDYPGKFFTGRLNVVEIGFPKELTQSKDIKYNLITTKEASQIIKERSPDGHKGTFGRVLVLSGSREFTGAAILTAISALKSGSGLVTLASVPTVCNAMRSMYPEIMCLEMIEDDLGNISEENFEKLKKYIDKSDCIITGPGVDSKSTFKLIKKIIKIYNKKMLIDAGAINLISDSSLEIFKNTQSDIIITPHIKEFAKLIKTSVKEVKENKIELSTKFCEDYNITLVLKSAVTLIANNEGNIYFNSSGNNGLGTGGTGDVLSGIIGGFCAQGYTTIDASILGVFLHGLTADIVVKEETEHTLTAKQIVDNLYKAIKITS